MGQPLGCKSRVSDEAVSLFVTGRTTEAGPFEGFIDIFPSSFGRDACRRVSCLVERIC
jgi:hypothetical protein